MNFREVPVNTGDKREATLDQFLSIAVSDPLCSNETKRVSGTSIGLEAGERVVLSVAHFQAHAAVNGIWK